MPQLGLQRNFIRFIDDPTFPYKATVCIDDERILCSGVLLAQQSTVLEKKLREDNGVIMFEEMFELENPGKVIHKCLNFLHGENLHFEIQDINVVLKFASLYEIKDLFSEGLKWLNLNLPKIDLAKSAEATVKLLKISNSIGCSDSVELKTVLTAFLDKTGENIGPEIKKLLHLGISGFDLCMVMESKPDMYMAGEILVEWCSSLPENRTFLFKNSSLFSFRDIFPCDDNFCTFVASMSEEATSEEVKALLSIQKHYYVSDNTKNSDKSMKNNENASASIQRPSTGQIAKPSSSNHIQNIPSGIPSNPQRPSTVAATGPITIPSTSNYVQNMFFPPPTTPNTSNFHFCTSFSSYSDENSESDSQYDSCEVYVGNIPPTANRNRLIQLFKFAGWICDVEIFRDDSYAILTFQTVESAKYLIDSDETFYLDGYELEVDEVDSASESDEENSTIYVGNVPDGTSTLEIKKLFAGFGKIEDITIKRTRRNQNICYAFVEYATVGSALAAVRSCETRDFIISGSLLRVEMSN